MQATKGFTDALSNFGHPKFQLFVAYFTTKPDAQGKSEKMRNVVMSVSVSSSEGCDVVVHMGIFRSIAYIYYNFLSEEQRTAVRTRLPNRKDIEILESLKAGVLPPVSTAYKNQSLQLHAEAAKFMLRRGKKYLVTSPRPKMAKLLEENGALKGFDVYEMVMPVRRLELRADDGTLLLGTPLAPTSVPPREMTLEELAAKPSFAMISEFQAMFPWWKYASYNDPEERVWMRLEKLARSSAKALD